MGYPSLIFTFFMCISTVLSQDSNYYTAAVVGFANIYDNKTDPMNTIRNNTNLFKSYIAQASAGGADIIIFPEYALTSLGFFHQNMQKDELLPLSINISTDKYENLNPCENTEVRDLVTDHITQLSCEAKKQNIYVVVNLIERSGDNPDEVIFYNTNIVFNRKGAIIAKYRKYNLYMEPHFSRPSQPDEVTFDTDFGVKFGIFTCFDIIFENPALKLVQKNITHFVYPTAWQSELPFLTALQVQSGWARANKVNLLAAGLVDPKMYYGGSGIYSTQNITFYVPNFLESNLYIELVPKNKFEVKTMFMPEERLAGAPGLHTMLRDVREYTYENLTQTNNRGSVVYKNFTCVYDVQMNEIEDKNYNYKVIAYQGPMLVDNNTLPIQVCSVVACLNQSLNSCGYINYEAEYTPSFPTLRSVNITANFANHKNSLVIPSLIDYRLTTVLSSSYTFERNNTTTTLMLNSPKSKMMTVGIIAHTYPNGASFVQVSLFSVLLAVMLVIKQLL